jgi:hypothetical protein
MNLYMVDGITANYSVGWETNPGQIGSGSLSQPHLFQHILNYLP